MVGRFHKSLLSLARQLTLMLLVVGIATLGAAGAGQMLCLPDCAMHQEVSAVPSCCEGLDMDHAGMIPIESGFPSSTNPGPCCEGKLCFDSPIDNVGVAAAVGGCETATELPPLLVMSEAPELPLSSNRFLSESPPAGLPIPIYLRTCTFLI